MGSYGSQNFKTLLLPQTTFESFQSFPGFSSQRSRQKVLFWIFETLSFRFLMIFFNFTTVPYLETKKPSIIWSEIWASGVTIQCRQGILTLIFETFKSA